MQQNPETRKWGKIKKKKWIILGSGYKAFMNGHPRPRWLWWKI